MPLADIRYRYILLSAVWASLWALLIIPASIPVLDQVPSPVAYAIFLSGYTASIWLLLFGIADENMFGQVSLATLVLMTGFAGADNIFPPYVVPLTGPIKEGLLGQNVAVDAAIGLTWQSLVPNAGNIMLLTWPFHVSLLFFLTYGIGTFLLLLPPLIVLSKSKFRDYVFEVFS